jgi:hypothetical protein
MSHQINYPLCFSTIKTILDWSVSDESAPVEPILVHLESLKRDVDIKIRGLKNRKDIQGKVGQVGPS